ncbi:MAG: GntR family transcriptional regulator, partial [Chloroflexota bacterium]
MTTTPLFQEIAESIRQAIISGALRPGDELPPVREMSAQWHCAPGTVQRAYQELAAQGLVVSRPGQGTRVSAPAPPAPSSPLRQAALVHRAESFLLGALAEGYAPGEIEGAVRQALDRWRGMSDAVPVPPPTVLRFAGSHDPAVSAIA